MALETVDLPSYKMVMFHNFLYVYQRVYWLWLNNNKWTKGKIAEIRPHMGLPSLTIIPTVVTVTHDVRLFEFIQMDHQELHGAAKLWEKKNMNYRSIYRSIYICMTYSSQKKNMVSTLYL